MVAGIVILGAVLCLAQVKTFPAADTIGSSGPAANEALSTLLTGLQAYYPLSSTADSLGSFNLTNNNGVTFAAGKLGNAAIFTGHATGTLTNASLDIGQNAAGASSSLWIRASLSAAGIHAVTGENSGGTPSFRTQFSGTNGLGTILARASGVITATSSTDFRTSTWRNVIWTFDTSDRKARIYVDGSLQATSTAGSATTFSSSGVGIQFGGDGTSTFFGADSVAELDEVGFWTKTISAAEIACLSNATPPAYPFTGVCQ
jgi:hypothetical protein